MLAVAILAAQLAAVLLFSRGFLPSRVLLPGFGEPHGPTPAPPFDRAIVMVVDAFRSDFAFSNRSHMPGLHGLIRQGAAVPFTAHSSPPTVTLPRIKGLTTGSTPNFLDAVLNIAESDNSSSLALQDSWLAQTTRAGRKIHMFGDDTWIKLFPGQFAESEGTASFFVSDYTEVDNNVTRHIDSQLANPDWDVLILHYLGLDHIGHKTGPESPFMPGKQREMDDIFGRLYEHAETENTLLVLLGDHGMNEVGNHGGSSAGETSAAMVFCSPKFKSSQGQNSSPQPWNDDFTYHTRIDQTDMVPTLSALLGLNMPSNNLGVFVKSLLGLWKPEEQVQVLFQNAKQMLRILEAQSPRSNNEEPELYALFDTAEKSRDMDDIYAFLYEAQSLLTRASSNYNSRDMVGGIVLGLIATVTSIAYFSNLTHHVAGLKRLFFLILGVYALSVFGTSTVEEEHQIWYWVISGWMAFLYVISSRNKFGDGFNWMFTMVFVRMMMGWNGSGVKNTEKNDFNFWLGQEENTTFTWALVCITYALAFNKLWKNGFANVNHKLSFVLSLTTVCASLAFKVCQAYEAGEHVPPAMLALLGLPSSLTDTNARLIGLARFSFSTLFAGTLFRMSSFDKSYLLRDLHAFVTLFLMTQSRTCNIPLFAVYHCVEMFLAKATNRSFVMNSRDLYRTEALFSKLVLVISVSTLLLQQVSFFSMGNSNSLATIDLSNAYNGISSYQIGLVGILTFVSNWIGPLYWSLSGLSLLIEDHVRNQIIQTIAEKNRSAEMSTLVERASSLRVFVVLCFSSVAITAIMAACFALKDHLFIWTVFSPKLLYQFAWTVLQFGVVDVLLAGVYVGLVYRS